MSGVHLHDLDRIRQALANDIDGVVQRLFLNARAEGGQRYWALGSIRGEPGGSLKIWRTGHKRGEWCDFSDPTMRGDALWLVVEHMGGKAQFGAALQWAVAYLGLTDETPAQRQKREAEAKRLREQKERNQAADLARLRRIAKGRFYGGQPIAGTPAERYLIGRAIDLRKLGRMPGALKYRGDMKCPESGVDRPTLIAGVFGPREDGRPGLDLLSIHRHFLECLPDGRVIKARIADPKQSYCRYDGGFIPVWRGASGKGVNDAPAGEWIVATEGVEDALSIALAAPERRIFAAVSLMNLGRMWLPPGCAGLYWHRHRGDGDQAVAAYERQRAALERRGVELRELWAPDGAKDFNEWLQRQAGLNKQGAA